MKKVMGWVLIIFLVFFVVSRPQAAAAGVKNIVNVGLHAMDGFGDFFASLTLK